VRVGQAKSLRRLAAAITVAVGCLLVGQSAPAKTTVAADLLDLVRVGDGAGALTNASAPVFIVPLLGVGSGQGTLGTPIALPTAAGGGNNAFTLSGTSSSDGNLNLSANGNFLTLAGYASAPGVASISGTTSAAVPRVVARVSGAGTVDTTTLMTAFNQDNVRGAASDDGTRFWVGGNGSGAPRGVVYVPLGNPAATPVTALQTTVNNVRVPVVANGNLYFSTGSGTSGIYQVGAGLPTTSGQAVALKAGAADPYSYVFTDATTLYIADGGIDKFFFDGANWIAKGTAAAPTALKGLTGRLQNGVVQLYATALDGSEVFAFADSAASNANITGSFTTIADAPANTAYKGVAFAPAGQVAPAPATSITLSDTAIQGVLGDPNNPTMTATVANDTVPLANVTLTGTSSNQAVVADAGIVVTGNGATRTVTITPAGAVGYATITLTATVPAGPSSTRTFLYGASAAGPDANARFLGGASDASAAIDVGSGYMVVGDDESNLLRLYRNDISGNPVKTWDFTAQLGNSAMDLEGAARTGNTIYWIGSLGNNATGDIRQARWTLFTTTVTGSGAATDLTLANFTTRLRPDLIAWDQANGHGLGADFLGFAAGAAQGVAPKEIFGFNVEGLELSPNGATAYIGFRAPLLPQANRTKALVVPVTNIAQVVTGTQATFGEPMLWDLGGLGIRDIRRNASGKYLIIAGYYDTGGDSDLYTWDGIGSHQPAKFDIAAPAPNPGPRVPLAPHLPPYYTGSWESIISAPDPIQQGAAVKLIQDDGDQAFYGDATAAKDQPLGLRKALLETFTLGALGPTAVVVKSFSAAPSGRTVRLTWHTASATGLAGFELWRSRGGALVRVGRGVIPASGSPAGAHYTLTDRHLKPGTYTYRLRLARLDGSRVWAASARVRVS
jgi:hypothetical protein